MYRGASTSPSSYPGESSFLRRALVSDDQGTPAPLARGLFRRLSAELRPLSPTQEQSSEEEESVVEEGLRHVPELSDGRDTILDEDAVRRNEEQRQKRLRQRSEQDPLLSGPNQRDYGTGDVPGTAVQATYDDSSPIPFLDVKLLPEIKTLARYLMPIVGTHLLEYSLMAVTVVAVGHLGTIELAAASLANMTANVTALSLIQGFCTALDTLCPQAYTSERKNTGLFVLRTGVILCFLLIPMALVFWNSEFILLQLRQDPDVAHYACMYLRVLILGLPGYAGFECSRRWLQAQGIMVAPVVTLAICAPLNMLLTYLFVYGPSSIRIGFLGAPLSTALSMDAMFFFSVLYAYFFAPRDAWGGLTWDMFRDLGVNVRLGLAGTAMVSSEWWCWEIVGLASSFLGPVNLAAQSVLITSASLFYQLPYALAVASAVRVGNLMGANDPTQAKLASRAALLLSIAISAMNSFLLVTFRKSWGALFSSEADVIQLVSEVLPLVALFQLSDGVSGVTGGVVRGAGKPFLGALVNLTAYYIIGLPIGVALTFWGPRLGLYGLWIGLTVALGWTGILMTWSIFRIDWVKECEVTKVRMGLSARRNAERATSV